MAKFQCYRMSLSVAGIEIPVLNVKIQPDQRHELLAVNGF